MSEEGLVFSLEHLDAHEEAPVRQSPYQYDLFVIGGGSGGLAAAKAAAELGAKVGLADFVMPSPQGTKWGIGGTCVNVGCIPKKLMHYAGLLGEQLEDQFECGWEVAPETPHNWQRMVANVQRHIGTLNWGYRVQLIDKEVTHVNLYAVFVDNHTVSLRDQHGNEKKRATSEKFVIAVGGRPSYGDFPGAKECCLTSDDLFSLKDVGQKILVVGASYIALECAGFLHAFHKDVTVMVRSIFLRGFDQEMAGKLSDYMSDQGMKFLRNSTPISFSKTEDGKVQIKYKENGEEKEDIYDNIILAIGREACTRSLNLPALGVELNLKNGKIVVDDNEKTSVDNIWAIGDVCDGKPELTPTAIQAGILLSRRLFGGKSTKMDYINIPTTVFTPLEYSTCGYSEEDAIRAFGEQRIEIFHSSFKPLEWNFLQTRKSQACFGKLIVDLENKNRVIGIHFLGPHAGEVMQGFAVAMKCGLTMDDLESTVGIHPTCAEVLTKELVTKRSGLSAEKSEC